MERHIRNGSKRRLYRAGKRRTRVFMPQEFGVYPRVSTENLLEHFAVLKGIVERRARREVMEALLLGGYPAGVRQRFGVAVALLGSSKLMVVDEPTAELDPAECVRFLDWLSELSGQSVVLLSSHVVEDVSELYARMAIVEEEKILHEAEAADAVYELRGRIWRRVIAKEQLPELERAQPVISTKLFAGRVVARIYGDACPGPAFKAAEPDREDVYFSMMAGHYGTRRHGDTEEPSHESST